MAEITAMMRLQPQVVSAEILDLTLCRTLAPAERCILKSIKAHAWVCLAYIERFVFGSQGTCKSALPVQDEAPAARGRSNVFPDQLPKARVSSTVFIGNNPSVQAGALGVGHKGGTFRSCFTNVDLDVPRCNYYSLTCAGRRSWCRARGRSSAGCGAAARTAGAS